MVGNDDILAADFGWHASTDGAIATLDEKTKKPTLAETLFENGYDFDFFQAVSILETIYSDRQPVGLIGRSLPAVRFAAHSSSNSFAASSIYEIAPATTDSPTAKMVVRFIGLTGPAGILPQHYSALLRRIEFESRSPEKFALRDWLDLFNDRIIAMFYRSWKKYRPAAYYGEALRGRRDNFTKALQSLCGLGVPSLSHQVRNFVPRSIAEPEQAGRQKSPTIQLALLRYVGLLSQRPRSATNLKQLLEDYFKLPVEITQFKGNWLTVDESAQTRLGVDDGNSVLGQNAIVGDQTWERQNKILVEVGPVSARQFAHFMPDYQSHFAENDFQLLTELTRLFVGPEMEFEIQLKLKSNSIPDPLISDDPECGMRLGWNTWLPGQRTDQCVADTVFCVEE